MLASPKRNEMASLNFCPLGLWTPSDNFTQRRRNSTPSGPTLATVGRRMSAGELGSSAIKLNINHWEGYLIVAK